MSLQQLHDHIHVSYHTIRRGIGVLGFIFPLALMIGGVFVGIGLQQSMSSYYHTPMRDIYMGLLCTIAFCLYLYKGYTTLEDRVLNLAGIFAFLTAILPTGVSPYHEYCAIIFFICIAYVCIFLASETLTLMTDPVMAARFRSIYITLGILMIVLPLIAIFSQHVFWAEFFAVWVFSAYWLVKCLEMKDLDAAALQNP
jgi:hypothetical membrane protein